MKMKVLPILIYGVGGASKEAYYCIKQINDSKADVFFNVLGFVEADSKKIGEPLFDNKKIVTSDKEIEKFIKDFDEIGIVIPIGNPKIKRKIFENIKLFPNIVFPNIIHPTAIYEKSALRIGQGNIIAAGTVCACDLELGDFNLINRICTTGHDVSIGNFNTLNPMAVISGNVTIGSECLIGAGSIILQELIIEDNATIGAGAVLTKNARLGETLVGVPAKPQ